MGFTISGERGLRGEGIFRERGKINPKGFKESWKRKKQQLNKKWELVKRLNQLKLNLKLLL